MCAQILVVEDNRTNQLVIAGLLASLGFVCDIVSTGEASLDAIEAGNYLLVFMDMRLPDMNGYEATGILRKAGFIMPIVSVTADDLRESDSNYLDCGMNGYLTKPLDIGALEAVLKLWLPDHIEQHCSASTNEGEEPRVVGE